jgi:tetratricopeptide (TPR) repeat protein
VVGREGVAVWDVGTGKGILTLRGAPPRATDSGSNATLAWSHDGRWLAATNWDGSVAVWDGNTAEVPAEPGPLRRVPKARIYSWHLGRADAALAARQPAAAAFHLAHLNAAEPPDLPARCRRAHLRLRHRDWEQAAADYAAVFAGCEPDDPRAWLAHARVLVLRGDLVEYRRLVSRMLARCGGNTDLYRPEEDEARASVLAPGAEEDSAETVRRAEKVVKDTRGGAQALLSLGLAHLRAGQYEKAVARATEAAAQSPDTAWSVWPLLALAHSKLGHTEEARRWLEKAEQWRRQESRRLTDESGGFAPPEWADFEILRREAAALIS